MNEWRGTGNVSSAQDPKQIGANSTVLNFTVAIDIMVWDSDSKQQVIDTAWISVEQFIRGIIEEHQMLYKGDRVYVSGPLTTFKRDEKTHTRVRADIVQVISRGRTGQDAMAAAARYQQGAAPQSQPTPSGGGTWTPGAGDPPF
jgi:single-stranded DNA-binding protein